MLSRRCLLSLFLIGSTSLFAFDDKAKLEVTLCACELPTEVIDIIFSYGYERFKVCHSSTKTPYDEQELALEYDFADHAIASFVAKCLGYDAYVCSDGTKYSVDNRKIGNILPSKISYSEWQKAEQQKPQQRKPNNFLIRFFRGTLVIYTAPIHFNNGQVSLLEKLLEEDTTKLQTIKVVDHANLNYATPKELPETIVAVLEKNQNVENFEIDSSIGYVGAKGIDAFIMVLKNNRTLKKLTLSVGDMNVKPNYKNFANALRNNSVLTKLNLRLSNINEEEAMYLVQELSENKTFEHIGLYGGDKDIRIESILKRGNRNSLVGSLKAEDKIILPPMKNTQLPLSGREIFDNRKYKFRDDDTYQGNVSDGKMHGIGVYNFRNGDSYFGSWYHNKQWGEGTYIWHPPCPDGVPEFLEGTWDDGKLVSGTFTDATGKKHIIDLSKQ